MTLLRNPLDVIAAAHSSQVQLCEALEHIADGLPDEVDRRLCVQAAGLLRYDIPLHHSDEELALFPMLRSRQSPGDRLDVILNRLTSEHDSDNDLASEIADSLDLLGRGMVVPNPEMFGYMLRGFFERYRRHIQWEEELVMPLARRRLAAEDLVDLARRMERNRGGVT
jgi:hemerythrin-like domain-containing protein